MFLLCREPSLSYEITSVLFVRPTACPSVHPSLELLNIHRRVNPNSILEDIFFVWLKTAHVFSALQHSCGTCADSSYPPQIWQSIRAHTQLFLTWSNWYPLAPVWFSSEYCGRCWCWSVDDWWFTHDNGEFGLDESFWRTCWLSRDFKAIGYANGKRLV